MENVLKFDLDDTSPTIQYSPFSDTLSTPNLSAGWNPYYDQSGFATAQGSIGNGTSLHITSLNGASLSVQWRGTGIQLLGNATSASYQITIDGQSATPQPDIGQNILTSIDGLDDTSHTVTLIAQILPESATDRASILVFDKAILTSPPVASLSNVSFKPEVIDDSEFLYLGNWLREISSVNDSFHVSHTIGDRVIASFKGPSILVQGKTSPSAAGYEVTLDNSTTTSLSGRSSFTTYNTTLYFATGLDPSVTHSVEIRNADGGELAFLVGGFNTFTPVNPGPGPSNLDNAPSTTTMTFTKGTLAAFILGGILGFIVISAALFYFLIYRPRRRRNFAHGSHDLYHRNAKGPSPAVMEQNGSKDPGLHVEDVDTRSGRSGFSRWRREAVEGSFRGVNLPLNFRSTGTIDEKKEIDDEYGTYEWSAGAVSIPPSDNSSAMRKAKAKSKGKARQITGRSWSPSIKLDFPLRRSQQTTTTDIPLSGNHLQSPPATSEGYMSSFKAAQPSPNDFAAAPPSYAASTSLHTSSSFVSSHPPSITPAVGPSTRADQYEQSTPLNSVVPANPNPHYNFAMPRPYQPDPAYHHEVAHQNSLEPPDFQDDNLLDPPSLHEVLRSLSPRTSVRPSSDNQADFSRRSLMEGLGIDAPSQNFHRSVLPDLQSVSEGDHSQTSKQPENARDSQASNAPTQATKTDESDPQVLHIREDGLFLSVTETSPFRVDFDLRSLSSHGSRRQKAKVDSLPSAWTQDKESRKRSRISAALSHVRFETVSGHSKSSGSSRRLSMPTRTREFVQGTSKAPFRLTPLTHTSSKAEPASSSSKSPSDGVTSFLDFTSSYEGSILSRSRSVKTTASEEFGRWEEPVPPLPKDPKSRWSNTTMPSDATNSPSGRKMPGEPKSRWSNTTVPSLGTNAHGLQESSSSGSQKSPYSGEVEIEAETEGALSTDSSTFPIPFKISIPPSPHHVMQPESSPERQSGSNSSGHDRSRHSRTNDSTRALTLASGTSGSSRLTGLHVHPAMGGLDSPTGSTGPLTLSEMHFNQAESEGVASKRTTSSSMPQFTNGDDPPPLPEEYRSRPFDPNILVNRVLGLPSPGVSSTMSTVRGNRPNNNADVSSTLASSSFATRTPSPKYESRFM